MGEVILLILSPSTALRAGYAKDYLTSSNTPLSRSLVTLGMRTWNSLVPSFPRSRPSRLLHPPDLQDPNWRRESVVAGSRRMDKAYHLAPTNDAAEWSEALTIMIQSSQLGLIAGTNEKLRDRGIRSITRDRGHIVSQGETGVVLPFQRHRGLFLRA
jgi:hypothetical protein